jgi:hypothetical protein
VIRVARVARDVMSDEMGAWMESWNMVHRWRLWWSYPRYGTTKCMFE